MKKLKTYTGHIKILKENQIFVFGSNPEGRHGAGAAKFALINCGAIYGQGRGLQGQSYGLITKNLKSGYTEPVTGITYINAGIVSVSPEQIIDNIKELYDVANENTDKEFLIGYTINPNLNGYLPNEMAFMFKSAGYIPENIVFNNKFAELFY